MSPPLPARGFSWTDEPWGPLLQSEALAGIARHGFTSRQLRLPANSPSSDGWARAARAVGRGVAALRRVRQVHGADVRVVRASDPVSALPDADAIVTATPGLAVAVVVADCVPVLLADGETGAVAAVHAGWRGTSADVVGATLAALTREWGVRPERVVAAIGPSIGACCYDVGEELRPAFASAGHPESDLDAWFSRGTDGRPRLDLWRANQDLLVRAGVPLANVHIAGLCTKTHVDTFESFRADGARAGRMAAIIVAPGG